MLIASETTSAVTPMMKIAATTLPTSANALRSGDSKAPARAGCSPV
jgi:hypothetical protein